MTGYIEQGMVFSSLIQHMHIETDFLNVTKSVQLKLAELSEQERRLISLMKQWSTSFIATVRKMAHRKTILTDDISHSRENGINHFSTPRLIH